MKQFYILIFFIFSCNNSPIKLSVPNIFSDGMVLQRDTSVAIWGNANPNEKIYISCSWGFEASTFSDINGSWKVSLKTTNKFGTHSLSISCGNENLKISDILMGEVWLAAGQSNMEMNFNYCCNTTDSSATEISNATFPEIRMFNVKKSISIEPLNDIKGSWESAVGENIIDFSAVGYFFAKKLHQKLGVPIGIIHSSWGGSTLESWTSHDVLKQINTFTYDFSNLDTIYDQYKLARDWFSNYDIVPFGSGAMDLLLSELFPEIGYLKFFLPEWQKLDYLGKDEIENDKNKQGWAKLDTSNSISSISGKTNFSGAVLFKNQFYVNEKHLEDYFVLIQPEKNSPWGLWEYDIYVNGNKAGSSLIDLNGREYKFNKKLQKYKIDKSFIKSGHNEVVIRVLGYGLLGDVLIKSSASSKTPFLNRWKVKILAEEYYQLDNYKYPYTSLYMYGDNKIDYSRVPNKVFISNRTIGTLYNGMIHPILPYGIKGIIWYQGESNIEQGGPDFDVYRTLFPLMVDDLRKKLGHEVPFYYAQIAPYFNYNEMLPYFQSIQKSFSKISKMGMVTTLDIGEKFDIHPSNKHDVGDRFSRLALNRQYGLEMVDSGPLFKNAITKGMNLNVYFDYAGLGLVMMENKKTWFELAGEDKKYYNANVINKRSYLQIFTEKVSNPKYVRYAWSDTASATLYNEEGLPASPFSSEHELIINNISK